MQTQPRTNGKGKQAKARRDADKQEVVQKPKIVVEKMDELVRLKHAADRAGVANWPYCNFAISPHRPSRPARPA